MKELLRKGNGSVKASPQSLNNISGDIKPWIDFIDKAAEELIHSIESIEKDITTGSTTPETVLSSLTEIMDKFVDAAAEYESNVQDPAFLKNSRVAFHQKSNHIFSKSYCFNRARTWPQGYHGDYKTLEVVYRNMPMSDGIGYYLDLYALNTVLGIGIRNRMKILQRLLKEELSGRIHPRIMSIACGSCRELVEISPEITSSSAHFTCIDSDEDALQYSQSRLYYTGIQSNIEFRKHNALRMFDYETTEQDFGPQDVIYSVGLFDYLESDFLVKILNSLYSLLNTDGKLIIAFKDAKQYRSQEFHWFMDWTGFLQRYEDEFLEILSDAHIPDSAVEHFRDETGAIIFYIVSKQ